MLHVRFHQCPLAPKGERRSEHGSRSPGFEVSETETVVGFLLEARVKE